jgi:hypothetical protein
MGLLGLLGLLGFGFSSSPVDLIQAAFCSIERNAIENTYLSD